jgi:hypothetical protein
VRACLQGSEREKKGERETEREREREREREKERKKEREREGGERESVCIGILNFSFYACKGAHTLFTDQREGEREKEGKGKE